ncbi:MAG: hypothetical protein ACHP85_04300 [Burkholderiales bacterium]
MRVALWTPTLSGWAAALAAQLERELDLDLTLVRAEPRERPAAELDLYHVAGSPEHGFVYRALRQRPGIVLLAEWGLHALVHAETAGRGDTRAYLREARHAHGDIGVFVARQVLAGMGGALPGLVAMNQRVLEASLVIVALTEAIRERSAAAVTGCPVVFLPLAEADAAASAASLVALIAQAAPRADALREDIATRAAATGPRARAEDELRWVARELGLAEPPADARALVAGLFDEGR